MIQKLIEALGGRKATMSLVTLLLGTAVEFVKPGGLSESYVMLLVGVVGIFSGANALVSWKGLSVGEQGAAPATAAEASTGDEANLKVDELARAVEAEVASIRAEQQVQAQALQKSTELIKSLLTIKQS